MHDSGGRKLPHARSITPLLTANRRLALFSFNKPAQASNDPFPACEICTAPEYIRLVKMDLMATSEAYDHEQTIPAVTEIPEPQHTGENDNKFQKAIAVWRGT